MNVKIPTDIPAGDYLLRAEALALHVASSIGGAQFYMTCCMSYSFFMLQITPNACLLRSNYGYWRRRSQPLVGYVPRRLQSNGSWDLYWYSRFCYLICCTWTNSICRRINQVCGRHLRWSGSTDSGACYNNNPRETQTLVSTQALTAYLYDTVGKFEIAGHRSKTFVLKRWWQKCRRYGRVHWAIEQFLQVIQSSFLNVPRFISIYHWFREKLTFCKSHSIRICFWMKVVVLKSIL